MSKPNRYYFYWQGKSPKVKAATEDYLTSSQPIKEISDKHQVSIVAISNNAKMLRYLWHIGRIDLLKELQSNKINEE